MTVFNENARRAVADAITRVERNTDAEVVTVLAPRADDYRWIGLFWAALVALLIPGLVVFFPAWLDTRGMLLIQWCVFVVLGSLFQQPRVAPHLVPRRIRHARAAALARRMFLAQNLHRTQEATGFLIFVAEAERYVEILADHGIASRVDDTAWSAIVDRFVERVKSGDVEAGFVECVEACGVHLAKVCPATHEGNELPNRLVVLDESTIRRWS